MQDENRLIINTDLAPAPASATSQCIVAGGLVFLSAQTGKMPDGSLPPTFSTQMKNAMYNSRAILEAANSDLTKVVRITIAISDAYHMHEMEELYKYFFPTQDPPTQEVMVVSSLPQGALVQVTLTAISKMSF